MLIFDHPLLIAVVAVLSWPVYTSVAKAFFGENYEDLAEAIRYLFQWDLVSLFKGEYWEDQWATLKFNIFLGLCLGWVAAISALACKVLYS